MALGLNSFIFLCLALCLYVTVTKTLTCLYVVIHKFVVH